MMRVIIATTIFLALVPSITLGAAFDRAGAREAQFWKFLDERPSGGERPHHHEESPTRGDEQPPSARGELSTTRGENDRTSGSSAAGKTMEDAWMEVAEEVLEAASDIARQERNPEMGKVLGDAVEKIRQAGHMVYGANSDVRSLRKKSSKEAADAEGTTTSMSWWARRGATSALMHARDVLLGNEDKDELRQEMQRRQQAVLPFLDKQTGRNKLGSILDNLRDGGKLTWDLRKYNLYNPKVRSKEVAPVSDAAIASAEKVNDIGIQLRKRYMGEITGMVTSLGRDAARAGGAATAEPEVVEDAGELVRLARPHHRFGPVSGEL